MYKWQKNMDYWEEQRMYQKGSREVASPVRCCTALGYCIRLFYVHVLGRDIGNGSRSYYSSFLCFREEHRLSWRVGTPQLAMQYWFDSVSLTTANNENSKTSYLWFTLKVLSSQLLQDATCIVARTNLEGQYFKVSPGESKIIGKKKYQCVEHGEQLEIVWSYNE